MLLVNPDPTPYDVRWTMFGIRVRVHPLHWIMSAVLGWSLSYFGLEYVAIWIGCVFISILWHEMGHVLVGRFFGAPGHIVLYSMGGLAIGSSDLRKRWHRILVYLGGPLFQLALFGVLWAIMRRPFSHFIPIWINSTDTMLEQTLLIMMFINFFWALFNLVPIFPLDGGQVLRDALEGVSRKNGNRLAFQISILISGFLALHAVFCQIKDKQFIPYLPSSWFAAILFGMLMMMNVQMLQAENQSRHWVDDRTPWDDPNW